MEGFGVLESLGKITDIAIVSYNQNDLSDENKYLLIKSRAPEENFKFPGKNMNR